MRPAQCLYCLRASFALMHPCSNLFRHRRKAYGVRVSFCMQWMLGFSYSCSQQGKTTGLPLHPFVYNAQCPHILSGAVEISCHTTAQTIVTDAEVLESTPSSFPAYLNPTSLYLAPHSPPPPPPHPTTTTTRIKALFLDHDA